MGTSKYTPELKARALEMVGDVRDEHPSEYAAIAHVAQLLNITTPGTLRKWVRQAEVDRGAKPGTSTAESEQVRALKREVAELKRANGILKAAVDQAISDRRRRGAVAFDQLIHHSDAGSQYTALTCGQSLADIGAAVDRQCRRQL